MISSFLTEILLYTCIVVSLTGLMHVACCFISFSILSLFPNRFISCHPFLSSLRFPLRVIYLHLLLFTLYSLLYCTLQELTDIDKQTMTWKNLKFEIQRSGEPMQFKQGPAEKSSQFIIDFDSINSRKVQFL